MKTFIFDSYSSVKSSLKLSLCCIRSYSKPGLDVFMILSTTSFFSLNTSSTSTRGLLSDSRELSVKDLRYAVYYMQDKGLRVHHCPSFYSAYAYFRRLTGASSKDFSSDFNAREDFIHFLSSKLTEDCYEWTGFFFATIPFTKQYRDYRYISFPDIKYDED